MKHKHYEMIVAKVANMNLETFIKQDDRWRLMNNAIPIAEEYDYFLCLPQHKLACLHWLNGGELNIDNGKGLGVGRYTLSIENNFPLSDFVNHHEYTFIIKPKKEKRWIAYSTNQKRLGCLSFDSEQEARAHYIHEVEEPQFIEIEVEV